MLLLLVLETSDMLLCVLLARYGAFELEFQANPTIINSVNTSLQRFATKSGTDPNHGHMSVLVMKMPPEDGGNGDDGGEDDAVAITWIVLETIIEYQPAS